MKEEMKAMKRKVDRTSVGDLVDVEVTRLKEELLRQFFDLQQQLTQQSSSEHGELLGGLISDKKKMERMEGAIRRVIEFQGEDRESVVVLRGELEQLKFELLEQQAREQLRRERAEEALKASFQSLKEEVEAKLSSIQRRHREGREEAVKASEGAELRLRHQFEEELHFLRSFVQTSLAQQKQTFTSQISSNHALLTSLKEFSERFVAEQEQARNRKVAAIKQTVERFIELYHEDQDRLVSHLASLEEKVASSSFLTSESSPQSKWRLALVTAEEKAEEDKKGKKRRKSRESKEPRKEEQEEERRGRQHNARKQKVVFREPDVWRYHKKCIPEENRKSAQNDALARDSSRLAHLKRYQPDREWSLT